MEELMKKTVVVTLVLLAFLLIFSGCNRSGDSDLSSTTAQQEIKMAYTFWGSAFERDAQTAAVQAFNEQHPGVTVEAMHIPSSGDDYIAKVTAMVAAGNSPDVGYLGAPVSFEWAKEGKLYDIFEFLNADPEYSKNTYVEDIFYYYAEGKSQGTTSSINPRLIFYNKECFDTAGLPYPPYTPETAWTWDQFVDIAKKLTLDVTGKNANDPGFNKDQIRQYGAYINYGDSPMLMTFLDSNGVDLLTEDGSKLALDTPAAKEVLQKMSDLINVHHVTPLPTDLTNVASDVPTALKGKRVAMAITGQWVLLDLAKAGVNYDLGIMPKIKEVRNVKDAGIRVIYKETKHPQEAWELYKFLQNPEGGLSLYRDGLWMPVLREWYDDPELYAKWAVGNPAHPDITYKAVVSDSLFSGISTPSWGLRISNFTDVWAAVNAGLQPLWLGTADVETVVRDITQRVNPMVKGYNPSMGHVSKYRK
jgi:multiple sugar transport system substrate-binding protein